MSIKEELTIQDKVQGRYFFLLLLLFGCSLFILVFGSSFPSFIIVLVFPALIYVGSIFFFPFFAGPKIKYFRLTTVFLPTYLLATIFKPPYLNEITYLILFLWAVLSILLTSKFLARDLISNQKIISQFSTVIILVFFFVIIWQLLDIPEPSVGKITGLGIQ